MELTGTGIKGLQNSVMYYCPSSPIQNVLFFQGDTQDTRAKMEAQYEEISQWKPWCLENTLALLERKFPDSAIWMVRPSRMLRSLFGCFHNFVQSSIVGIPTYRHGYGGLLHLEALLLDLISQVHAKGQLRVPVRSVFDLPLVLVGFSKGCVVLNQAVYEFVNYVNPENLHLRVPYHHCSSSSLHHPQTYVLPIGHRKTPSVSSVSSLSSMEEGSNNGGKVGSSSSSHHQSPAMAKRKVIMDTTAATTSDLIPSPSLSRTHSNSSINRHPSVSSLNSETGDGRDHAPFSSAQHRSRSRSPMFFSRSGSSSSTSQGRRVIPLAEDDILRIRQLLGRLHAMYWLDAGHSGGRGAWVVDDELLRCLATLGTSVHVHVTPQQVADPNRGWIRDEEREFVDKLRHYGASVTEVLHFEHEERSLEKHFRVLNEF